MERIRALSVTIPPPVGGWNARDPLELMPATDAISLVNFFPSTGQVDLRAGYRVHATGMGSGAVRTVAELPLQSGTRKLVAAANGNIYDASTYNAAATSLGSGFSVNNWQTVVFKNVMIFVNGTDQPQQYDGTTLSAATYTGVTDNDFINVSSFKGSLLFVEKNSASIWYPTTIGDITGACTEFPVDAVIKNGGYVVFAGTWTRDTGSGAADLLFILTSTGECLVYQGDGIDDTNLSLISRLYLPAPIGYRCVFYIGPDPYIITQQGVIPASEILQMGQVVGDFSAFSDKIKNAFNAAARNVSSNFGWQGMFCPRSNLALINIPISSDTTSEQYIVNTITGAWARWVAINASSWCTYNDKPYFGGMDGKVYEFEGATDDNGDYIQTDLKTAFNYAGDTSTIKQFTMVRPIVTTDSDLVFDLHIDVDFQDLSVTSTASISGTSGSPWDSSPWDSSPWDSGAQIKQDWYGVSGIGRNVAINLGGQFKNLYFAINSFNLIFTPGGLI